MPVQEHRGVLESGRSVSPLRKAHAAVTRIAAVVAALPLFAGCGGDIPIKESSLASSLPQQTAKIVVGQSDRTSVRAQLGTPWVTSDDWRFDLFRATDENSMLMVVMLLPMAYRTEDIRGYVLVNYDDRGMVTAVDYGIATEGDEVFGGTFPASVSLAAGNVAFWASPDEESYFVAVSASRGDDFIQHNPPKEQCRVLLGSSADCGLKTLLDRSDAIVLPRPVPLRYATLPPNYVPFDVKPGNHELEFASATVLCSYEAVSQVSCGAGETRYVTVTASHVPPDGHWHVQDKYLINVETSADKPWARGYYGLFIYANGRWLLPDRFQQ